jgi:hypothetical protein
MSGPAPRPARPGQRSADHGRPRAAGHGRPRAAGAAAAFLLAVVACVAVAAGTARGAAPPNASAPAESPGRFLLVVMPEGSARALAHETGAALALGVAGPRRAGPGFVARLDGRLAERARAAGARTALGASPDAPAELVEAARRALGDLASPVIPPGDALRADLAVLVLASADQAAALVEPEPTGARTGTRTLLVGVGPRTPVLVAEPGRRGILRAGDRPRPGIVIPDDLRATALAALGAPVDEGERRSVLRAEPRPTTLAELDRWTLRFERDEASRYELSVALAAAVYGPLLLGWAALWLGRRGLAARLAAAGVLAPAGYLAALFLAEAGAARRVLPVVGAALAGLLLPPRAGRRAAWAVSLGVAAALLVGTVLAPLRPTAEPALTLWGPPVALQRLFGLVNHLVALMLDGLLVGWALGGLPAAVAGLGTVLVATTAAAAPLGANFVSALWVVAGGWAAVAVRRAGWLRLRDLVAAGAAGALCFAAALAAAPAGPASHGLAAAERIGAGPGAGLAGLVRRRVEVNLRELAAQPLWFRVYTGALVVILVLALLRALRRPGVSASGPASDAVRAGSVALVVAALVTLVAEDTGVLVAPLLAAAAGLLALAGRAGMPPAREPAAEPGGG